MEHNQFHKNVIRHILNGINLIRPESIRFLQMVYQFPFYSNYMHHLLFIAAKIRRNPELSK